MGNKVNGEEIDELTRVRTSGVVETIAPPFAAAAFRYATGLAINASGDLAGKTESLDSSKPTLGWVLIGAQAFAVGFPGALYSVVRSINDHGVVAGESDSGVNTFRRAIRWQSGQQTDLSTLQEVRDAGWRVLTVANAINNRGVIVGNGVKLDGTRRSFMLIPTP